MEELFSLIKDEKIVLSEISTVVTDEGEVEIYIDSEEFFEVEFQDSFIELEEIIKEAIKYAGYFDYVETNTKIGFLALYISLSENVERPLKVGMYLEVQDGDFHDTDLPKRITDFLDVLGAEINDRYKKPLN